MEIYASTRIMVSATGLEHSWGGCQDFPGVARTTIGAVAGVVVVPYHFDINIICTMFATGSSSHSEIQYDYANNAKWYNANAFLFVPHPCSFFSTSSKLLYKLVAS